MKVSWRRSAIESLMELDQWRETIELPKFASYLKETKRISKTKICLSIFQADQSTFKKSKLI